MVQKQIRKVLFSLVDCLPQNWRDSIYRSRLHIPPPPEDIYFGIAETPDDLDQAFRILHDAYVKEGFSKPFESGRRITEYHMLPSTTTLVAKLEDEVIATVSIIRDGSFGLPIDKVSDLSEFRDKGERLGEVSSLAIKQKYRGRSGAVLFYLFKYLVQYSINYFGIDRFLIVVNPSRRALYESILMFTRLRQSDIESYEFANNAPGVCGHLDLRTVKRLWKEAYRNKQYSKNIHLLFFGGYSPAELKKVYFPERHYHTIEDPVMTPEMIDYFFKNCTEILPRLDDWQIEILRCIYRDKAYGYLWRDRSDENQWYRRSDRRFDVNCSGLLQGEATGWEKFRVMDASRRGLRIATEHIRPEESAPRLNVVVGQDISEIIHANLRWQSGCIQGLEIIDAGPSWEQFIDYMEERRAQDSQCGIQNGIPLSNIAN